MTRTHVLRCAVLMLVVGCGRAGDRGERAADTMSTNAAAGADSLGGTISNGLASAADALDIEDLALGRTVGADGKILDKTDDFRPNDEIIAVIETDDNASGKELVARWTYGENDQLVNEERQTVAAGSDVRTTFRLKKAGARPVGRYHLRIMHNGREVKSEAFEVKSN